MAGFVLKSHYGSTAERASVVRAAVPGVDVRGAIALNRAVGGINPLAVEIAAREGARTVWLPTVDSVNESHEREAPPGAKVPVWVKLQLELREQGIEIDPVPVVDEHGTVLPALREVLGMIARHDMLLATGHLSRDEIFAVVDAAVDAGVEDIVDHPPRVPLAEPVDRGPERARGQGGAARALLHHAAHRQGQLGAVDREHPRYRTGALGPLDRPRPGVQPAGRGRDGADGRPAARGRLQRGGGARDGGRQHARSSREPRPCERSAADGDRSALGRLRVARGRGAARSPPRTAARPGSSPCPTASAASPASCGRRRARRSRTSRRSATARRSAPRERSARASSASTWATIRSRSTARG